ncbi:MAG: branched-chain amino acid ABC transporter permease [Nitrososphaeria archaeon]
MGKTKFEIKPLRTRGYLISVALIIFTIIFSVVFKSPFLTLSLTISDIFILLAVAWDFSSGTTNYINFGISFFFGVGTFSTGFFYYNFRFPVPLLLVTAIILGLTAGFIFTIATMRVRGVFFTLLSLLLPLIGTSFVLAFWTVLKMPTIGYFDIIPIAKSPQVAMIYISIFLIIVTTVLYFINSSHFGIITRAIGDDESALIAQGVNSFPYKIITFSASMGIAAFAGSIYAMTTTFAGVDSFGLEFLLYPMVIAILGGKGKILGAVPSGFLIILMSQYLQPYVGDLTLMLFSALAIALFLFLPEGISRWYS